MKYYYEYKEKNGCKVGGHNLERIEFLRKNPKCSMRTELETLLWLLNEVE